MNNSKDTVCIVTSIHPDFDSRIWKHARTLARSDYRVVLICPWNVKSGEVIDNVEFHTFVKVPSRALRPFLIPARVGRLIWKLRKRIDLFHFHDFDLLPLFSLVRISHPVVYDVHENYADEMLVRDWIPAWLRKPLYYFVKGIQAVCSRIIKNVVLVTPEQLPDFQNKQINQIYIKNYATVDIVERVKDDYLERPQIVVFSGSQYENNGSLLLLDIAKKLSPDYPKLKFLAFDRFGSPGFRAEFHRLVKEKSLENHIILHENVLPHELVGVLNKAVVALNPNLRVTKQLKAISTKLFEYMAAGIPMVVSDLPFQEALIKETGAGLLAQPEDAASFARQIAILLDDPNLAAEIGGNGREWFIKKYNYEAQIDELCAFYNGILRK